MMRSARAEDARALVGFDSAWAESQWRSEIEAGCVWVLEQQGRVQGALCRWEIAGEYELHRIVVAPPLRRQGFGRHMLADALDRDRGVWLLEVAATNRAALSLYESLGFVVVGRRERYYPDGDDALLMRRDP